MPSGARIGASQTTILITRPEPGASQTAARVAAMGFIPLIAPALAIETTGTRLPPADAVAAVVLTSGNALAACLPSFRDAPLLTVGDATAARARSLGFSDVTSGNGDASVLAAMIVRVRQPRDGSLLLVSGRRQGGPLARDLRQAGFRVIRRVVYQSVPARVLPDAAVEALRAGRVRAALFFSAETAHAFVRLVQRAGLADTARTIDALAIGNTAGVALQALPWRRTGVAATPTQDAMLALLR